MRRKDGSVGPQSCGEMPSGDSWPQGNESSGPSMISFDRSASSPSPFSAISLHAAPRLKNLLQDVERAVSQARGIFHGGRHFRSGEESGSLALRSEAAPEKDAETAAREVEAARKEKLVRDLAVWHENPHWVDQPPNIQVTAPPGSFCDLSCHFTVGLPPEAVYDILCDPDNHHVFKNIKEVKARQVLEDRGTFQRVLVEQTAIWRFLWLSGTFDVFMDVATDKSRGQISYRLCKGGFMKRFEGKWEIEPLLVPGQQTQPSSDSANGASPRGTLRVLPGGTSEDLPPRVAAQVTLRQRLQPAVRLPPPIGGYVRGISAAATKSMLEDLQAEARRVREGRPITEVLAVRSRWTEPASLSETGQQHERADHTRKGGQAKSRRRNQNRFRQKLRENVR